MPRNLARALTSVAAIALLSSAALAQAGVPELKPQTPEGAKPPAESTSPPADPSTGDNRPNVPLTEKLKEGEGVLEPPRGMDPEIEREAPVPNPGTTPVLPPPGRARRQSGGPTQVTRQTSNQPPRSSGPRSPPAGIRISMLAAICR